MYFTVICSVRVKWSVRVFAVKFLVLFDPNLYEWKFCGGKTICYDLISNNSCILVLGFDSYYGKLNWDV